MKRLFHGDQMEKCNSFHWRHFRGIRLFGLVGGRRGDGGGGAGGRTWCLRVCCSPLCSSIGVYEAFKSLQMCCGLRPASPPSPPPPPPPEPSGHAAIAGPQLNSAAQTQHRHSAGRVTRVFAAQSESPTLFLACKITPLLARLYFPPPRPMKRLWGI